MILNTRTIDLACPTCAVAPGVRCIGGVFCPERKKRAAKLTREANLAAKRDLRTDDTTR